MSESPQNRRKNSWNAKVREYVLVGYINSSSNLPDYADILLSWDKISNPRKEDAWTKGEISTPIGKATIHLYRKRIILTLNPAAKITGLNDTLLGGLEFSSVAKEVIDEFGKLLHQFENISVRAYPLVRCGKLQKSALFSAKSNDSDYINDGLTSFYTRIYDSDLGEIAIVRISRHITVVYGLGDTLIQDIINLIYDDMLYSETITSENVFDLYDSMNKYILPLEINLFVQKLFYGLAIFAAFAAAFATFLTEALDAFTIGPFYPSVDWNLLLKSVSKTSITFLGLIVLWLVIRRVIKSGRLGT